MGREEFEGKERDKEKWGCCTIKNRAREGRIAYEVYFFLELRPSKIPQIRGTQEVN